MESFATGMDEIVSEIGDVNERSFLRMLGKVDHYRLDVLETRLERVVAVFTLGEAQKTTVDVA